MKTHNPVPLIIIDMQKGFLNQNSSHVIKPVRSILLEWRKRDEPVIFTRFINESGSQWEKLIKWNRLRESPETDITAELTPHVNEVYDKKTYTSFTEDVMSAIPSGVQSIVLCGIATDGCILATAIDCFERGYRPIVVKDACASHAGQETHDAGLFLLERFIGREQVVLKDRLLRTLGWLQ